VKLVSEPEQVDVDSSRERGWLEADRSVKVSETLARKIFSDIKRRQLTPGVKLPGEAIMLKQYGVGRASLREALRILEVHGIIKIKPGPGGGPIVDQITSSDFARSASVYLDAFDATVADLMRARLELEPRMARLAATKISRSNAAILQTALERERAELESGEEWSPATEDFHSTIAGLTGNPVLDLIGKALIAIHAQRGRQVFPLEDRAVALRTHERLGQAILEGDADKAERLSRRHLLAVSRELETDFPYVLRETIDWY
jgi:GntR family transcriptional regulator, transcriptional repressor for pyruvate dehydrogenase complex